jgi:hypothetical protein
MKKRLAVKVAGGLMLVLILLISFKTVDRLRQKQRSESSTKTFSAMCRSLHFTPDATTDVVFVYFNSECEFCQWEIAEIEKNMEFFQNCQLLLASFEPRDSALKFLDRHNLSKYYLDVDPSLLTETITGGVPQVFVYKDDDLAKHYAGEVKIDAIVAELGRR